VFAPPTPLLAIVPTVALPPAIPLTSHVIAAPLVEQNEAVNVCVCPSETFALAGEIESVVQVIVTVALPLFVLSATLVAVTVTIGGDGTAAGAIYVAPLAPLATMVPTVELPPAIPLTLQVTAVEGLPVPVTFAMKTCAPAAGTFAEAGDTLTTTSSSSVTLTGALAWLLAALTAVTVTTPFAGRIAGAVYRPPIEIDPTVALPPATPFTLQLTLVFEVPATIAWNCCVCPRNKVALSGRIVITMLPVPVPNPGGVPPQAITAAIPINMTTRQASPLILQTLDRGPRSAPLRFVLLLPDRCMHGAISHEVCHCGAVVTTRSGSISTTGRHGHESG
jgi:hypothetical protein